MQQVLMTAAGMLMLLAGTVQATPAEGGGGALLDGEVPMTFQARGHDPVEAYEGGIMVPENRADPASRMIPVRYVRFPARAGHKGPPIIYLAGGPGGSGTRTAKFRRFKMFMALRDYGDVIALDQRGTGVSDILPSCESSVHLPMDKPVSDQELIGYNRQALEECFAFWDAEGIDIRGYNTNEIADDLDDLRVHLGADKIILWGTSYGSHLALAALKRMEDKIERVILSSAEGLDQTVKSPTASDRYFDRLQAAIDTQPEARAVYPDIKALIRRVHDKLEKEPVRLNLHMRDGARVPFLLQRHTMQRVASGSVSDPWRVSGLLAMYLALDNDTTAPLEEMLGHFFDPRDPISFRPMSVATDIASGLTAERKAQVALEAETALLRDYLNFTYHFDGLKPELDLGDSFRAGPNSSVPVLLFSGTLDGRTFVEEQLEAVKGLSALTSVTVVNAGHNLFMSSPEVQDVINRFMERRAVERRTITLELPNLAPPIPD